MNPPVSQTKEFSEEQLEYDYENIKLVHQRFNSWIAKGHPAPFATIALISGIDKAKEKV